MHRPPSHREALISLPRRLGVAGGRLLGGSSPLPVSHSPAFVLRLSAIPQTVTPTDTPS